MTLRGTMSIRIGSAFNLAEEQVLSGRPALLMTSSETIERWDCSCLYSEWLIALLLVGAFRWTIEEEKGRGADLMLRNHSKVRMYR